MAAGRIKPEPIPIPVAGPLTTKCVCGWEIITIQPEEEFILMRAIFRHLVEDHGLDVPVICNYWH